VLIVDDDDSSRFVLSKLLQLSGHHAVPVEDAARAMAFVKSTRTDLILLDVMMPGISGLDFLRQLRADAATQRQRVVMYSAVADSQIQAEASNLGAIDYWLKGDMRWSEIGARIDRYLAEPPLN
jgi:two-component system phosphate regulon response regulator PhoB